MKAPITLLNDRSKEYRITPPAKHGYKIWISLSGLFPSTFSNAIIYSKYKLSSEAFYYK